MRFKIITSGLIFTLIFVYVGGCRKAGLWLMKKDDPKHADAMVILMGSIADRILHAVDIYKNRVVDKVIIVEGVTGAFKAIKERGVNIKTGTEQMKNIAVELGIPTDSMVILPGNAQSTLQEALIVKEYLSDKPDLDTILLVSSAHHTRRAYMIFKNAFTNSDKRVFFICSPSPYSDFNAQKWWKSKDGIETVMLEYLKIMNFFMVEKRKLRRNQGNMITLVNSTQLRIYGIFASQPTIQ